MGRRHALASGMTALSRWPSLTAFLEESRIDMGSRELFAGQTVGQAVRPDIYPKKKSQRLQAAVRE
jgi:hypothetical protein